MRVHPTQDGMFTLLSRSVRTHLFCFYSLRDVKSFGEESPVEEFAGYDQQAIHPSLPKTRAFWPSSVIFLIKGTKQGIAPASANIVAMNVVHRPIRTKFPKPCRKC
jgi:hypothetical protein